MTKKKGLDTIPPPPRPVKPTGKAASQHDAPAAETREQFNVRITHGRKVFVNMLAAKLGRKPYEMVEEALDLLEAKHGAL